MPIGSHLPDTSHSLRPYALASSSSNSSQASGQYALQQAQPQYRNGAAITAGGGTTGSPLPSMSYGSSSRHQSPLTSIQQLPPATSNQSQQGQMHSYTPQQRLEDPYSTSNGPTPNAATGGRPMSIDGRMLSSSGTPQMAPQPVQEQGFRRVRGPGDLTPRIVTNPTDRRADPHGSGFLSVSPP